MTGIELVLGLLAAVIVLATLARRLGLPYPIVLVVGGGVLGFVPGLPRVELAPDLVFLIFLPPLLYVAAFFTSIRDFKGNAPSILTLAVGLVLFTMTVVALVARAVLPGLPWPAAFALGAIVAPPDAIAATAVLQRLGVPRRLVTILEGESLLNDATALVAYRLALAAAVTSTFSLAEAASGFVVTAAGGVAVGFAVGGAAVWIRGRTTDTPTSVTVALLTPYAAYLPAEALHVSGVLAVVVAGLIVGRNAPRILSSETRVTGAAVWQMVVFILNGLVFILVGLQLRSIVLGLERPLEAAVGAAAAVTAAVIVTRLVWLHAAAIVLRVVRRPPPAGTDLRSTTVLGWAGMRGAVSLAAALALPHAAGSGGFADRDLLIFITYAVIAATLVGQGLTLPGVIRVLRVARDEGVEHEEGHARSETAAAARARLDELYTVWPTHRELLDNLKATYDHRARHLDAHHEELGAAEQEMLEHRQIRLDLLETERATAHALRDRGAISDEVLRRLERELDLEELRMEA